MTDEIIKFDLGDVELLSGEKLTLILIKFVLLFLTMVSQVGRASILINIRMSGPLTLDKLISPLPD